MKRFALGALLVIMLGACTSPTGTIFKTTAVQPDGSYPMPVTLGDETGLVRAIESTLGDASPCCDAPTVKQDPDAADAVILTFFTGACDDDATVSLRRSGAGFEVRIDVNSGLSLGCTAQLLIRGLRIRFSEPVAADMISVVGGP